MDGCKRAPTGKHEFYVIAQVDGAAISKCLYCGMAYEHYLHVQREGIKGHLKALLLLHGECPKCVAVAVENVHFRTLKHKAGCELIPFTGESVAG